MARSLNKPKGFGEILDHTFQLSKQHFTSFIKIFLILMGPIFLLEALIYYLSGISFFREMSGGGSWLEQIINSFEESDPLATTSLMGEIWLILLGLVSLLIFPIASAAVLVALNHVRKSEEFTAGSAIKQAFSRFWPILGSNIVVFLIFIGLIIGFVIIITMSGFMGGTSDNIGFMILLMFIVVAGGFLGIGLLFTRWSFYFASVVLDHISPGITRSWQLSKGHTWRLFGLYIVFSLIIGAISFAVEMTFGVLLGNSVLFITINNLVLVFTTMIFSVAYAVMFFDLKARNSADDIKDMIDEYHGGQELK